MPADLFDGVVSSGLIPGNTTVFQPWTISDLRSDDQRIVSLDSERLQILNKMIDEYLEQKKVKDFKKLELKNKGEIIII